jgi:hypothetical protein
MQTDTAIIPENRFFLGSHDIDEFNFLVEKQNEYRAGKLNPPLMSGKPAAPLPTEAPKGPSSEESAQADAWMGKAVMALRSPDWFPQEYADLFQILVDHSFLEPPIPVADLAKKLNRSTAQIGGMAGKVSQRLSRVFTAQQLGISDPKHDKACNVLFKISYVNHSSFYRITVVGHKVLSAYLKEYNAAT